MYKFTGLTKHLADFMLQGDMDHVYKGRGISALDLGKSDATLMDACLDQVSQILPSLVPHSYIINQWTIPTRCGSRVMTSRPFLPAVDRLFQH